MVAMSFVGRDVVLFGNDIHVVFLNMRTRTELVYVANSTASGDGVDVVAGNAKLVSFLSFLDFCAFKYLL